MVVSIRDAIASCRLDGETHCIPRTVADVGHIIGAELDGMKSVLRDVAWEADSRGMVATFTVDGELYELRVGKCSPELREELGYEP